MSDAQIYALERVIAAEEWRAEQVDKLNPGDSYASLMCRDDIDALRACLVVLRATGWPESLDGEPEYRAWLMRLRGYEP